MLIDFVCVLVSAFHQSQLAGEVVLEVADKLGSCAVGELDPAHPGNEIVVSASKGPVLVVHRQGDGWQHELAFHAPGEMIQVAAGDALPEREGDEIVAVGMLAGGEDSGGKGAVHVIWREGMEWKARQAFEADALVHGVAIGTDGVWVAGFDGEVHLLRARGETFEVVASAGLPGAGKNALAFDGGVIVPCTDGSLVEARLTAGRLVTRVIDRGESGRARVGGTRDRLVVCDDDGKLALLTPEGLRALHGETRKLRGAVLADLDPSSPGLEAATTGYSGRVTLVRDPLGTPRATLHFTDRAGFHHAAAGELDGAPGLELVVCGMAGRVLVFGVGGR
jgi:hypothetical protein